MVLKCSLLTTFFWQIIKMASDPNHSFSGAPDFSLNNTQSFTLQIVEKSEQAEIYFMERKIYIETERWLQGRQIT